MILPAVHHAEEGVSKFHCKGGKPMQKSMRRRRASVSLKAEEGSLCGGESKIYAEGRGSKFVAEENLNLCGGTRQ